MTIAIISLFIIKNFPNYSNKYNSHFSFDICVFLVLSCKSWQENSHWYFITKSVTDLSALIDTSSRNSDSFIAHSVRGLR